MRRVVALLTLLFPAAFRELFRGEQMATFDERWREQPGFSLATRTILDLIRSAFLEHAASFQRRRHLDFQKGDSFVMTCLYDFRFALRNLRRTPGFAAVVVAVLAIGIGANSAIFSLVDSVLLRPLPFAHPGELVMLWEHPPGYAHNSVSPLTFADWSEQNKVFSSMAAVSGTSATLRTAAGPERIPGQSVSVSFFDLLGVKPLAGRTFRSEDDRPGNKVVAISGRLWRSHYGGDPSIVGRSVEMNGAPYTVVGIIPDDFQILFQSDLWTVFVPGRGPEFRRMHYLKVLGRLKPGIVLPRARADMALLAANIARIAPDTNKDWGVTVEPLRGALIGGDMRVTSAVLAGVVGLVLLMAWANVANLLLARGIDRAREFAVRASLGGSHARILGQLLTESALLAALGGAAGLLVAWIVLLSAPRFLPAGILPIELHLNLNARVAGFAALLTLATSVLFGFAPAWHASRVSLADALRSGGRSVAAGIGGLRSFLATGEIAVAVLLVSGAGLLLRTASSLRGADPGYYARNVLTMHVTLPLSRYPAPEKALPFYQSVEREISRLPGVEQVGLGGSLPLDGWDIGQSFSVVGEPSPSESNEPAAHYQIISAHYFDTLGIRLLRGRAFTEHDTGSTPQICIVNEELVRKYLHGREPLGASLSVEALTPSGPKPVVREIVGVIHQVKVEGLGEKEDNPEIYVPIAQNPWYAASITVRTAGDPLLAAPAVRAAIARADPEQPVTRVRTMDEVAAESIAEPRFRAQLVGAFAVIALVLASVGVFGVLAFSVGRRTREFGIRMALGARGSNIIGLVLKSGLKMVGIGVAVGLAAAIEFTHSLVSLLYGVKPLDPVTFLAAPLLLSVVALAACLLPAVRAARVDPGVALHHD
jgi:putative ABC transport system permease protein